MRLLVNIILLVGLSPLLSAIAIASETVKIRPLWSVSDGLDEPESVAIDEANKIVYASNVVGYGLNGQGYISRISLNGSMIEPRWLEGLNGPTGMVLMDSTLYFADVNQLVTVDVKTKQILGRYPSPDPRPCLNDVALSSDGAVFVSGSCSSTIYTLKNGQLVPFIRDREALRFVNGLFVAGEMLLSGGWQIRLWNRYNGEALANGPVTMQRNVKDIDGIAWDGSAFLMSLVDDARLWRLKADGVAEPISDEAFHAVDFHYNSETGLLVMPQIFSAKDHRISAFRLTFEE